jgi:signal transduction histidine kinase
MSGPVRILVADDVEAQRLSIEVALAELGETVVSVESGREALKFLLDHDAAVILLDVNMPGMDGFETAALIRQRARSAHTPIIFLTADTDEMQAIRGYALGAVDYLFCPFHPEVLRTKVKVFAELSRMRERVRREAEQRMALHAEQTARAAAEEQSRRLHLQVETGMLLARSLEGAPFTSEMVRTLVPGLGDLGALRLFDAEGRIGEALWARSGPDGVAIATGVPQDDELVAAMERAAAQAEPVLIESPHGARPAGLALPFRVRGHTYGVLGLRMMESGRSYTPDLLDLARLIASRTAIALDNRRLVQQLQERDRLKDEFLAMLSHELRNPLGAIVTAVRLLELLGTPDERATRAREVIARQSLQLARMVDDLLEVSRVTAGQVSLLPGPVIVRDVLERAVETLRAAGRLPSHRVVVRADESMVEADDTRLEQILTNLLVNAVKYTDPGGEIVAEVEGMADEVVIQVKDTGIGISPELLPRVFDVFVQGRQTLDRAEGGLGLGLALVRKLVELHGGTVLALSDGPGTGSTFVVRLPRLEGARPPASEAHAPLPPVQSLRVLIVEDDEDGREMMRSLLTLRGHEVIEASTGLEAIEIAHRKSPHLALVDLGLPGIDGFEVGRRLRVPNGSLRPLLVAITGYGQPQDRKRALEAGFDAHLVKPVSFEHLRAVLEIASRRATESVET